MKKIILLFTLFALMSVSTKAQTVTIGSGTSTTTSLPIVSCYGYTYSQQIYTAAQVGQSGTIEKIRFYYNSGGTTIANWNDWTIYMAHSSKTTFASTTDWEPISSFTQVFSGTISPVAGNWFEMTLSTPFSYNGTDNLIVAVDENVTGYSCSAAFRSFTSGTNTGIYYRNDTTNPDPATPPTASGRTGTLAQMQLVFPATTPPNCTAGFSPADAATGVYKNATLSWDAEPSATSYDVYFGTSTNPGLVTNVTTTSYTPALMADNTTYYWRIVPKNAIGDATSCAEISFTTGTEFLYCTPSSNCSSGAKISNFATTGAISDIANNTGTSSCGTGGYNDFTSISASVAEGTSVNVEVGVGSYSGGVKLWADWNNNGSFEAGELLAESASTISSGSSFSGAFTVPSATPLGDYRLRVRVVEGTTTFDACSSHTYGEIEDYTLSVVTPPSCMPPSALTATNITDVAADLGWTENGTATTWNIEWGTAGFTPTGTPTITGTTTNPHNLTGLTATTSYDFYVQADCGGSDTSTWSGPYTFTTACSEVTTFTEGFESTTGSNFPSCWAKVGSSGSAYPQNSTGISGSRNLYMFSSSASNLAVVKMIPVSNANDGTHSLSLKVRANFTIGGILEVGYLTDANDAATFVALGSITTNSTSVAQDYAIHNVTTAAGVNTLALRAGGSPANSMLVDDVVWDETPSCFAPSTLTATNITDVAADLGWTENGTATTWNIEWGATGFTQGSGTMVTGTTTNPHSLSGLTANTSYDFYVQADCGGSDTSTWAGPYTFITDVVTPAPYLEEFITTVSPDGWGATSGWYLGSTRGATGNPGNNIYKNFWSSATSGYFYTVNVDNILSDMLLTFDYQFTNYSSPYGAPASGAGTFDVLISTDFGENFTSIGTITLDGTAGWQEFSYNLASYVGQTVRIAISGTWSSGDWDAAFDNFKIDFPDCATTTTWDGSAWDNGAPTATSKAVFAGDYTGAGFDACSLEVTGTSIVDITSGALNIDRGVTVVSGASLTLQNDVNLVQVQNVANSGDIMVNRDSTPMIRLDYTGWSSPVVGQNLLAFSPNTVTSRFYTYNENGTDIASAWSSVDPSATDFASAIGYLIRVDNTWSATVPAVYNGVFTGVPNNGDYTASVVFTTGAPQPGFNLVGNPYPSTIDADTFITDNAAVGADALHFWSHATAADGSGNYTSNNYASYTSGGGGVASAGGGAAPDGTIQIGQGFMVHVASSGDVAFNNGQRLTTNGGQFFKTTSSVERHRVWLNLSDANTNYNQMMFGYITDATMDNDSGIDAKLFSTSSTNLYSLVNNEEFVIQGRSLPFDATDEVPLGFTTDIAGTYIISIDHVDGLFDNQDIYLWDKDLNVYHDLNVSDYSFASAQGTFNNRFSVVYSTALKANTVEQTNAIVYVSNNEIIINSGTSVMNTVNVYDIQGRLLVTKAGINTSDVTISGVTATNQVLLVEIFTTNGKTTKKVKF